MDVDKDGFLVSNEPPAQSVVAPPPSVAVPKFFDGCQSLDEAARLVMNELTKPYSYEMDGIDEMYRRLSLALVVIMAKYGGVEP